MRYSGYKQSLQYIRRDVGFYKYSLSVNCLRILSVQLTKNYFF